MFRTGESIYKSGGRTKRGSDTGRGAGAKKSDFENTQNTTIRTKGSTKKSGKVVHITHKPELLAPAGSPEALKAAVSAGADAVYLSGRNYGARRFAVNFDENELKEAVAFCHARGVKVYLTLNTLVSDDELPQALSEMLFYYSLGVDAVLVQDLGLLHTVSKLIPDLVMHASTQMTINNSGGVAAAEKLGLKRVVLAREVSLKDVNRIGDSDAGKNCELEIFVHGALCFCYSGQCLFSSLIGGRSGNRGMCAQPCRKRYSLAECKTDRFGRYTTHEFPKTKGSYLLSPRDLCTYENLPDVLESKAVSLKIEGRMKSPEYVAIVVDAYRRAIDQIAAGKAWSADDTDRFNLQVAFNRQFTGGYLMGEKLSHLMSYDRPNNRGVFLGEVTAYDEKNLMAEIKTAENAVPKVNDGLAIRRRGFDDGFILRAPYTFRDGILRAKTSCKMKRGDSVYITHRDLLDETANVIMNRDGTAAKQTPISIHFSLTGENNRTPKLVGTFELNLRKYTFEYISENEMVTAEKHPVTAADLKSVFAKCGGTHYSLKDFSADYNGELFLPNGLLNELRRGFLAAADDAVVKSMMPNAADYEKAAVNVSEFKNNFGRENNSLSTSSLSSASIASQTAISCYADSMEGVKGAVDAGCRRIYYECDLSRFKFSQKGVISELRAASEVCSKNSCEFIWSLSRITPNVEIECAIGVLNELSKDDTLAGVMVNGLGAGYAIHTAFPNLKLFCGTGLNIYNSESVAALADIFGPSLVGVVLSHEMSAKNIAEFMSKIPSSLKAQVKLEYIVSGAVELMTIENDVIRSSLMVDGKDLEAGEEFALIDEKEKIFSLRTDGIGRTRILNSVETCLIDSLPALYDSGLSYLGVDARGRNYEYTNAVVKGYTEGLVSVMSNMECVRTLEEIKKKISSIARGGITEGHYRRGV